MSVRVDPNLAKEIVEFGGKDLTTCYHCGNCSAVCDLSEGATTFPRRAIRYLQLGLQDRFLASADPWLCYYCGDCTVSCPREANPGELMMASRRYLTTRYDWTGLSRKLYLSKAWEFGSLILLALGVVALFVFSGSFSPERMNLNHVSVNQFAPVEWVHYGDWALAAILVFFLATNALRMHHFILGRDKGISVPFKAYVAELKTFLSNALTQRRWRQCDRANRVRWFKHLLLMIGYATMFLLVVFFLPWFQRDTAEFHFTSLFGYYATAFLLYYTVDAMIGRLKKTVPIHESSHLTDWMFLILLFLTTFSGILLHLFRMFDLPMPTYIMYVGHLAIAVPMLLIEVPFGKWAHLLYRPLAAYLHQVKEKAESEVLETTTSQPAAA